MSSEEFTSLSTGCFAVKPSKRKAKVELPLVYKEESKDSSISRFKWYTILQSQFSAIIHDVLDEINTETVKKIINFIQSVDNDRTCLEIVTLAIIVGVNGHEYNSIYEESSKGLKVCLKMECVTLTPTSNSTNEVTHMLRDLFNQVLRCVDEHEQVLIKTLSLKDLFKHVSEQYGSQGLVVNIPRFDLFTSNAIETFINLCISSKMDGFPIYFIFGLVTGRELSSDWISTRVMSQLNVELLTLPSPTSLLERILQKSLLSPSIPFKFSYRTFEVLLSRFSLSNYGIHDVVKTLKIAMLSHCCQQPLTSLLDTASNGKLLDLESTTDAEKALIIQLPSMQEHVEKLVVSNKMLALQLLEGDVDAINKIYEECHTNYNVLYFSFRILHCLIKNIPGNNLVTKPLELYSLCIQGKVSQVSEVSTALKCLGMMQRDTFLSRLESACAEYETFEDPPDRVKLLNKVLRIQISQMKQIMEENVNKENEDVSPSQPKLKSNIVKIKAAHRVKNEKLENFQKSFISRLENYYSTLSAPTTWPMNEVIWYSNHSELQNLLVGKCRTSLHQGLSQPNLYLQCADNSIKPDICHMYDLYHEHGRLICLHDWLQSYNSTIGTTKISNETHARFIRAVSELNFMGYLKTTKRKTDHVAKLSMLGY